MIDRLLIHTRRITINLKTECYIADMLAEAVQNHFDVDGDMWATQAQLDDASNRLKSAFAAWKESRQDRNHS